MISLGELLEATGVRPSPHWPTEASYTGFAYDSRGPCQGRVFVAVRTATGDGHEHIAHALSRGAAAVLCEAVPVGVAPGVPVLEVGDVLAALADWARLVTGRWRPKTIAVGGSLGKTTTKELLAAALSRRFRVTRSPGSYSGRLGLPVALGEMRRDADVAVMEFGTDGFGEMQALCSMAPPEMAVITNVCERHLDVFGSLDNAAAEMGAVLDCSSMAVVNCDDERSWRLRERARGALGFGLHRGELRAHQVRVEEDGLCLRVAYGSDEAECRVTLFAPALVYDCLAALGAALLLGLSLEEAVAGLGEYRPLPGRMNPLAGQGGVTVLDDTFGGSPTSALAALGGLGQPWVRGERHAVVGGLEDWEDSWAGPLATEVDRVADVFWGLGDQGAAIARELARAKGHVLYSYTDVIEGLKESLQAGDVVLVKGGRAARLERIVASLVGPSARDRLVRQEPMWDSVRMVRPERPTWVELDVEALGSNTRLLRQACGVPLMAVLKADAYGHGAARTARVVLRHGAESLGVACLGEASALRRAGIEAEILVLGYTPAWQARQAVREGVSCAVFGWEEAEALARAGADLGTRAVVQVKVDTGMARLGLTPEAVPAFLARLARLSTLEVRGIFTHFGSADSADLSYTRRQLDRFQDLLDRLEVEGLRPPVAHAANTAAALRLPESRLDLVRVGIGLYGLDPSSEAPLPEGFRPVLSLKTTVAQVKVVPPGTYVGYGRAHLTDRETTVAVIPVGYADGFRRGPRNWGSVLVRGRHCPILGNVCMDQAMVDVSGVPGVRKGDEVVLIGRQGDATIGAADVAARLGTIAYEVVSEILARVPRMT
ncbi:MAG: alanine racemase [Anaerolineae bacterium]|nr:alanine racemase [Anaerolineae bacterium]